MADDQKTPEEPLSGRSHANVTQLDEHGNPAQPRGDAVIANLSQEGEAATASERKASPPRELYPHSIEDAERYFLDSGYEVAARTISNYCQQNQFRCRKFTSNGVRRWFIKKQSLDTHIEEMRRDGHAIASVRMREPKSENDNKTKDISQSQDDSKRSHTNDDPYLQKYITRLEGENDFLREQLQNNDQHIRALEEIAKGLGGLLALPEQRTDKPEPEGGEGGQTEKPPEAS